MVKPPWTKLRLGPLLHQLRQGAKVSEMRRVVDGFASLVTGKLMKNCGGWNMVMNLSRQVEKNISCYIL